MIQVSGMPGPPAATIEQTVGAAQLHGPLVGSGRRLHAVPRVGAEVVLRPARVGEHAAMLVADDEQDVRVVAEPAVTRRTGAAQRRDDRVGDALGTRGRRSRRPRS